MKYNPVISVYRLTGFLAYTYTYFLVYTLRRWFTPKEKRIALRDRTKQTWCKNVLRWLKVKVELKGSVPQTPFFLVSNHLSYLDIFLLDAYAPACFIAKSEVARWPMVGFITTAMGTLYVNREKRSDVLRTNQAIRQKLESGENIIVFPEGTSSDGSDVLPFYPSLFQEVAEENYPVHCAWISYRTPEHAAPAETAVCWWGGMTLLDHLFVLMGLPEIRATLRFSPHTVCNSSRKVLAEQARKEVVELSKGGEK